MREIIPSIVNEFTYKYNQSNKSSSFLAFLDFLPFFFYFVAVFENN